MRHRVQRWAVTAAVMAGMSACTSPPSVSPLLRVVDDAVRREAELVRDDMERDGLRVAQARRSLEEAFMADLRDRPVLDQPWVLDAVRGYTAACEELVRHEMNLRGGRERRAENLLAAAEAQRRAIELIERQDALITGATGLDLWRLRWSRPSFSLPTTTEKNR
ncbi:MAG: hypothetical protein K8S99_06495 [Planctomycetes bacterium]|nr:hypothetical protein [Planctomycetota bacterium]